MPRKGPAPKRPLVSDPVFSSPLVTQLVNKVLKDGKRSLDNVKPALEVKSRRVGGATYQVPIEVRAVRQTTLGLRWLVSYAGQRREKTMVDRLMNELLDASNGLGAAVKRREDMHKMAESNKAFAHYRW